MNGPDVRQLHGEDLPRLAWTDLAARVRSLGEAQLLVPHVDEFDYLAACADDRVVGIVAVGYRTPYGGASLASLSVDRRPDGPVVEDPTDTLLARLEQRATERTCLSVELRVDVDDRRTLELVETRGYGLVGATTTTFPSAGATPGHRHPPRGDDGTNGGTGSPGSRVEEVVERHVDSWLLRKELRARAAVPL